MPGCREGQDLINALAPGQSRGSDSRCSLDSRSDRRSSELGAWQLLQKAHLLEEEAKQRRTHAVGRAPPAVGASMHQSARGKLQFFFRVEARPPHLMQRSGETRLQMRSRPRWVKPVDSKGRWLWERGRRAEWARHRAVTPEIPEPWSPCTHRRSSLGTLSASAKPTTTCLQ